MAPSSTVAAASRNENLVAGIRHDAPVPDFRSAEEQIRVLLRTHLRHGSKGELGALTGQQLRHVSAQMAGESGLRLRTVQAGIWLLAQDPETEAVAAAIRLIGEESEGFDLVERRGLVLERRDGQLLLPGVRA